MNETLSKWSGGYAEWVDGETAFLSIVFTWELDRALTRALFFRACGYRVRIGGPAIFQEKLQHDLLELDGVQLGGDIPDAIARHNPAATVFSQGCPKKCWFCIVPKMHGNTFILIPDAPVRPVLCDNNLSALDAKYQDHIIARYMAEGVPLRDANSGFEPETFTPDVYERWKPLLNAGRGPWRFAYDELAERDDVLRVMKMLVDEPAKRKQVYVLIGNEPFEDCMRRIQEVIDHGCEPYVQPVIKLTALERKVWVQDRLGWTERQLLQVQRWANRHIWRSSPFADYDGRIKTGRRDRYDTQHGLFV